MPSLKDVTLLAYDDYWPARTIEAMNKCWMSKLPGSMADIILVSNFFNPFMGPTMVRPGESLFGYQKAKVFHNSRLNEFVKTDFVMICQWDSWIINPQLWTDHFLDYDMIGAPWWYTDGHNVGNEGFCILSKKYLEVRAKEPAFKTPEASDSLFGREMRPYLEERHGIRFAPEEVAARFSWELNDKYPDFKNDSFGFHGKHTAAAMGIEL